MAGRSLASRRKLPLIHAILIAALVGWALAILLVAVNAATLPRLAKSVPPGTVLPRVSLVVPARNEEWQIGKAVSSQLAQEYPDYEVIVVNDRSTDRTGEILASLPDPGRRLRVIDGTLPPEGWLGKPHALAQGSRAATGELLLFVDADVVYHPRALIEAVSTMETLRADFLCLGPRMEGRGFWENVLMPYVMLSFLVGPGFLSNLDRPRLFAAGGGAGNLIRREAYDAVGGHEALKNSVVDDVRLAFAVKWAGFRTRAVLAFDRISVRMYRGLRGVWNGFAKNIAYVFEGVLGIVAGVLTAATIVFGILPPAVLAASVLGADVPADDTRLAAIATALLIGTRLLASAVARDPLWPSFFHPFMAAVWTGIIGRSLYLRIVRRTLSWRGRDFDARGARF